jgi:AcrR family transcriptional regulator
MIVAAAVRLADAEGLDGVSIRRLAAELDARPMSLYDYFESKDELLGAMAEAVVGEVLVEEPLPNHWREALEAITRRTYEMMVRHGWLVFVASRPNAGFGPNAVRAGEQYVQALSGLRLEDDEVWAIAGTLNDYVLGHALRIAADPGARGLARALADSDAAARTEFEALGRYLRSRDTLEHFQRGLAFVLNGIEADLATRGA